MSPAPSTPSSDRSRKAPTSPRKKPARLLLESLEDRSLLSCNTISGFVYHDANGNGLRDPGEQPIAHSQIELRNAAGVVVAGAVTDDQGFYQFTADQTADQTPRTLTK